MAEKITIAEVDINMDQAMTDAVELKKNVGTLTAKLKEQKEATGESSAEYIQLSAELKNAKAAYATQEKMIGNVKKAHDAEAGSLDQLKTKLAIVSKQWSELSEDERNNSDKGKELTAQKLALTEALKKEEKATGDSRRGVGEYERALDGLPDSMGGAVKGFVGMAKAAWAFIATPIGAAIAAIVVVVAAVASVFKKFQPLIEWFEQKIAAVTAVVSVLKNAFLGFLSGSKSLSDSFSNLGSSMADAAKRAHELKKAQQELEDQQNILIEKEAKSKRQIDELMLQSKDRTKSEKERIELIDKALKVEEEAYNRKKKMVDDEYDQKVEQIAIDNQLTEQEKKNLHDIGAEYLLKLQETKGIDNEEVKSFAELSAKREDILDESINIREKAINRQNALLEKQEEAEQKRIEASQKAAEKQKEQKEKEAEEAKKKAEKELEDKRKAAEEAVKIMKNELEAWKIHNKSKLENSKELTRQLIDAEDNRLTEEGDKERSILKMQLDDKLISQSDYDLAIIRLEDGKNTTIANLNKKFDDQEKQRKIDALQADYDNANAIVENQLFAQFDIKKREMARQQAEEIKNAEKTGASINLINKKYAKAEKAIETAKRDAKLALAQQAAQNLATIFGESTAAGKAAAVAMTTIETFRGAQAAYTGMIEAVPGPVGIALGITAAAAAVATGIANVKKILSVSTSGSGGSVDSSSGVTTATSASSSNTMVATQASVGNGIVSRSTDSSSGSSSASSQVLVVDDVTKAQKIEYSKIKTSTL